MPGPSANCPGQKNASHQQGYPGRHGLPVQPDPATADYPCGQNSKPSVNCGNSAFRSFILRPAAQNAEALVNLGYGGDPDWQKALQIIREKQDAQGRWMLEIRLCRQDLGGFRPLKNSPING
jgi:hypothetical protein